ncbi:PREDICTED: uncharacterized protein LOC109483528 [Branchiostoma belcheri]|uniref:Uncharacterized protein LOC109483528 n=1 Tax=Branchiostoma belcheri TaxID=7741 RepID=A0A6P4ZLQ6_BRABE|nr:PREDICTED: uncharacterized protein LOC109483528 [Branchiostoma belcheri]
MEGNSSDITWGTPDDRLWVVRLKASFMSIECILAMFGNIVVMLFTTTRNTFPRNASVYIFAMAVADFVKGVGYASHVGPFLAQDMAGAEAWCQGWGYVQSALRFSSIHLVTCVSVDRCLAIWWTGYSEAMSFAKSVVVTFVVSSVGVLATVVPVTQGWATVQFQLREGSCTFEIPQNELLWKAAVPGFFVLVVVPLVIAVVANVLICIAMALSGVGTPAIRARPYVLDQPRHQDQIELDEVKSAPPPLPPGCSAWPDDEIQEAPLDDDPPADKGSTEETHGATETGNDPMDPAQPGPQQGDATARHPGCCRCRRVGSKSLIAIAVVAFGLQILMHAVKIYDAAVTPLDDDVYFALVWLSNCHAFTNAILYSVVHKTFHLAVVMDFVALFRFLLRCCGAQVEPEVQPSTSI